MTKNMTRKGFALGAGIALLTTGLVAPAQAVGNDGLVGLAPESGTAYSTLLGSAFDLEANFAQSLEEASTSLKFMVTDSGSTSKFDLDINGSDADAATAWAISNATWDLEDGEVNSVTTAELLTITIADGSGIIVGDTVTLDMSTDTLDGAFEVVEKTNVTTWILESKHADDAAVTDISSGLSGTITQFGHNGLATATIINERAFGVDAIVGVTASADSRTTLDTYVVTASDSNDSASVLRLTTSSTTTVSYDVVAWHDTDSDGKIDSTESKSPTRTVTFTKASDAGIVASLDATSLNDVSVSGTVNIPGHNMEQLASDITVMFKRNGYNQVHLTGDTTGTPAGAAWAADAVTYSTTKLVLDTGSWDIPDETNSFENNSSGTEGEDGDFVDSATWSAVAVYGGAEVGNNSANTALQTVVNGYKIALDKTDNTDGIYILDADITTGTESGATARARVGAKSFTVTINTTTDTTLKTAVANVPVSVVVAPSNIATADAVTVNGTSVVAASETITGLTDASGNFVMTVSTATGNNADQLTFTPTVQGYAQNALTVIWTTAAYTLYNTKGEVSTTNDNAKSSIAGSTINLGYEVYDQFDVVPANNTYAVKVTRAESVARATTEASWAHQASFVGGKASVTVTDNGVGATGADTVTATLYPVLAGGSLGTAGDTQAFVWTFVSASSANATAVSLAAANNGVELTNGTLVYPVAIEDKDFVTTDTRWNTSTLPEWAANNVFADKSNTVADSLLTLSGTLTNVNGAGVSGDLTVTSSKAGVMFKVASGSGTSMYATDAVTFATPNGAYSVNVYSHVGGTVTFTVSDGVVSKTVDVTFASASAQGENLVITSPTTAPAGTTYQVTGLLTDAFGNPVEIATAGTASQPTLTVTYSGPGFVSGSLPTTTTAAGTFAFSVLLGSNDSGTGTITASYDADGTTTTKAAITTTASVAVGVTASATKVNVGSFNGKLVVYALNASGSEVSYKIAGKWVTQVVTSDSLMRYDRVVGATGVTVLVDIYVDGVKKVSRSVVTK